MSKTDKTTKQLEKLSNGMMENNIVDISAQNHWMVAKKHEHQWLKSYYGFILSILVFFVVSIAIGFGTVPGLIVAYLGLMDMIAGCYYFNHSDPTTHFHTAREIQANSNQNILEQNSNMLPLYELEKGES